MQYLMHLFSMAKTKLELQKRTKGSLVDLLLGFLVVFSEHERTLQLSLYLGSLCTSTRMHLLQLFFPIKS